MRERGRPARLRRSRPSIRPSIIGVSGAIHASFWKGFNQGHAPLAAWLFQASKRNQFLNGIANVFAQFIDVLTVSVVTPAVRGLVADVF